MQLAFRCTNQGKAMGTRANQRKAKAASGGSVVTRMCSISTTGVIFASSRVLEVSSELALSIQTDLLGLHREWSVQGWVIECTPLDVSEAGPEFQVTLLFSEIPAGLQQLLLLTESAQGGRAYPVMRDAEIFGLN